MLSWLSNCLRGEEILPFPYLPGICQRTRLLVLVRLQQDHLCVDIMSVISIQNLQNERSTDISDARNDHTHLGK